MAQFRNRQIAEELKREIADIVRNMKDPRLQMVSVLAVQVDNELDKAKVYVSHLTQEAQDESVAALKKAAGYIRSELAKRLKTRTVPELVFVDDHSIEAGFKITEMLSAYDKERVAKYGATVVETAETEPEEN